MSFVERLFPAFQGSFIGGCIISFTFIISDYKLELSQDLKKYREKMNHFPTGVIVIIDINDRHLSVSTKNKVSNIFRQIEFAVCSPPCSIKTRKELMAMIITTRQYSWPESCHFIGFFFIGEGMVDSDSKPYFKLSRTKISAQNCIDEAVRQNARKKFPNHLKLIFFFDCCFCCDTSLNHSSITKPFAFDFPPKSIVAFATSPGKRSFRGKKSFRGKRSFRGKTACIPSWSNEFCKQLKIVQKGHTLTEVLELTIEKVIKEIPHFKQHPPQFFSSAGPIVLKGMPPNIIATYICYYYFMAYSYYVWINY